MRPIGITAFWLSLAALVGALAVGGSARAGLVAAQATPAAATPAAVTPVSTPDVVVVPGLTTLVAWYRPNAEGSLLEVLPVATAPDLAAAAAAVPAGRQPGRVDFPTDGGPPTIVLGESTFTATPIVPDDPGTIYRWLWFNGIDGERPATLVLQVTAAGGPYEGFVGTATFVSRGENAGGVLVILVSPPVAAEEEAAAAVATEEPVADVVAEEIPAEEAPVEEAPVEDVPVDQ